MQRFSRTSVLLCSLSVLSYNIKSCPRLTDSSQCEQQSLAMHSVGRPALSGQPDELELTEVARAGMITDPFHRSQSELMVSGRDLAAEHRENTSRFVAAIATVGNTVPSASDHPASTVDSAYPEGARTVGGGCVEEDTHSETGDPSSQDEETGEARSRGSVHGPLDHPHPRLLVADGLAHVSDCATDAVETVGSGVHDAFRRLDPRAYVDGQLADASSAANSMIPRAGRMVSRVREDVHRASNRFADRVRDEQRVLHGSYSTMREEQSAFGRDLGSARRTMPAAHLNNPSGRNIPGGMQDIAQDDGVDLHVSPADSSWLSARANSFIKKLAGGVDKLSATGYGISFASAGVVYVLSTVSFIGEEYKIILAELSPVLAVIGGALFTLKKGAKKLHNKARHELDEQEGRSFDWLKPPRTDASLLYMWHMIVNDNQDLIQGDDNLKGFSRAKQLECLANIYKELFRRRSDLLPEVDLDILLANLLRQPDLTLP